MSLLTEDVVGCDFCEVTSSTPGRSIYVCDECDADVCSEHSAGTFGPFGVLYCDPSVESGHKGCAPADGEGLS